MTLGKTLVTTRTGWSFNFLDKNGNEIKILVIVL